MPIDDRPPRKRRITNGRKRLFKENIAACKQLLGKLAQMPMIDKLRNLSYEFGLSLKQGDLRILNGKWYVTHDGLVRLSSRRRCHAIRVEQIESLCDINARRFVLKATVYPTKTSAGFTGYGDADPSNVSDVVRGAELRMAETRAVSRALRKAYGVPVCSVEEIGSIPEPTAAEQSNKLPPQPANGNSGHVIRDRLHQLINRHQLDPILVKAYATDFCSVKTLREASREQIENFVAHLTDWAEKDRNALLCQLNSYLGQKEGAA